MRRSRSLARTRKTRPARCPKPPSEKTSAEDFERIIELTDSEDEVPPPRKRQRIAQNDAETIDLTVMESGSSRTSPRSSPLDSQHGKEEPAANQPGKEENPPTRLVIEQDHIDPSTSAIPCDAPPVSETLKNEDTGPMEQYLAQILEVVPDVQAEHARSLLIEHEPALKSHVVAAVLHLLFEQSYPKVQRNKGKRKREDDVAESRSKKEATKDYGSSDRQLEGGLHYVSMGLNQLFIDFPHIPVPHIRQALIQNNSLYAPTHIMLREQLRQVPLPFKMKSTPTRCSGKGKHHDAEFDREHAWLQEYLKEKPSTSNNSVSEVQDDDTGECEDGIECGCCFSTYIFSKIVQCPDAHLFCTSCMTSYVENQLGQHDPNIRCMDQSGCKLLFADAELKRFLSPKLLDLYERVKQAKEIESAELDGLEECPFCEYKVVIENPEEKLFRCQRDECSAISCRACKKLDHLPKNCKEAEEDNGLNARHKVEEAMTEALMRSCPKCKKGFIKEGGCNKMVCPNCRTMSCYICRQIINGYEHFDSTPPGRNRQQPQSSRSKQKCLLWDPIEQRHDEEVAEARDKAIQKLANENPEVDKKQLEVELPKTNATQNPGRVRQVAVNILGGHARGHAHAMPARMAHPPRLLQNPMVMMPEFGINIGLQFAPMMRAFPLVGQHPQLPVRPQAPVPPELAAEQQPIAGANANAILEDEGIREFERNIVARRMELRQRMLEARNHQEHEHRRQRYENFRRQLAADAQGVRMYHMHPQLAPPQLQQAVPRFHAPHFHHVQHPQFPPQPLQQAPPQLTPAELLAQVAQPFMHQAPGVVFQADNQNGMMARGLLDHVQPGPAGHP